MSVRRIWMIGLLGVWSGLAAAGLPQSGRPLPVGSGDTLGPLAMPEGLRVAPAGAVALDGAAEPDLLVYAHTGLRRELRRYHFSGYGPAGQPVFHRGEVLAAPWLAAGGNAFFFRGRDGVYGCSLERPAAGQLRRQLRIRGWRYVASRGEFEELLALDVPDSLRPYDLIAIPRADGRCWQLVYSEFIPQKGGFRRTAADRSSYYDGAGVFRNPLPRSVVKSIDVELSTGRILTEPELLTPQPLLGGLRLGVRDGDKTPELVAGNQFGALWQLKPGVAAAPWRDDRGGVLLHPVHGATPRFYAGSRPGWIVGGEGALQFYAAPVAGKAAPPVPVLEKNADLYGGTLAVPAVTDWDGDGANDLIAGNSEGKILFFKNLHTNREPRFASGVELTAGGEVIHIQPGYYGIQGPNEARWGYVAPTVTDWNGDGLPDIVFSDATAQYRVLLNRGSRTRPELSPPQVIRCEGLPLHGTWRVRPGVADSARGKVLVTLDDDNALHLYFRLDDTNVADGGKLHYADGRVMQAHYLGNADPGQSGRAKLTLGDWDGDGRCDLIVGSMRRHCFPGPEHGLPWTRFRAGQSGLQLLYFRNIGSNEAPRFELPRQFQFRGRDLYLGSHTCAAAVAELGDTATGPNLVLGAESGRFYFFDRRDLTFAPFEHRKQ